MSEPRTFAPAEDPMWGMTVDPAQAREKGLTLTYRETEFIRSSDGGATWPGPS